MKKRFILVLLVVLVVVLSACGNKSGGYGSSTDQKPSKQTSKTEEGGTGSSTSTATKIQLLNSKKVGNYLADGKGMTLYYYKKDKPGKSNCTGGCLQTWPAYYGNTTNLMDLTGFNKADFGTITRKDTGKKQITYKGYPLYYYAPDQQKGDTNGQGVGNVWYIINAKTSFSKSSGNGTSSKKNGSGSSGVYGGY